MSRRRSEGVDIAVVAGEGCDSASKEFKCKEAPLLHGDLGLFYFGYSGQHFKMRFIWVGGNGGGSRNGSSTTATPEMGRVYKCIVFTYVCLCYAEKASDKPMIIFPSAGIYYGLPPG